MIRLSGTFAALAVLIAAVAGAVEGLGLDVLLERCLWAFLAFGCLGMMLTYILKLCYREKPPEKEEAQVPQSEPKKEATPSAATEKETAT